MYHEHAGARLSRPTRTVALKPSRRWCVPGLIDHSDSLGAAARFGGGDVQWLTAGQGIQHAEMFPLLHSDRANPLELFQVWLNLPARSKMAQPHFCMFWNERFPGCTSAMTQAAAPWCAWWLVPCRCRGALGTAA